MQRFLRRSALGPLALVAVPVLLAGCFDASPTGPAPAEEAPTLPAPEHLKFDFGFFQPPSALERASKDHFWNAYLRVVIASAVVDVMLTPPIAAFALALNTPPSPQPDGSWLWVYTYVEGDQEAQIRLRGTPIERERVRWELRVTNPSEVPPLENALWFEGETWNDGDAGFFRFHDLYDDASPAEGRIDWGEDPDGTFLRLTDLADHPGDTLEFRELGPRKSLVFTDASDADGSWFVKWDEATGTGSLRAPDYNGGEEACWDEHQNDTACPPAA